MNMPEKTPGLILDMINWLNSNAPIVSSVLAAFAMASFKSRRDGEGWISTFYEAAMCGCFSLGTVTACEYMGLSANWAVFFGVIIGYVGTKRIGSLIDDVISIIRNKFGGGDGKTL